MEVFFKVYRRDKNHWDIWNQERRIYTIRGEEGDITLHNEIFIQAHPKHFKTLSICMAFLCDELMYEIAEPNGSASAVRHRLTSQTPLDHTSLNTLGVSVQDLTK